MGSDRRHLEHIVAGSRLEDLHSPDPALRRIAVAASRRWGPDAVGALAPIALEDPAEEVRAEAIEILGTCGSPAYEAIWAARGDRSSRVAEAVATALGEVGGSTAVPWLIATATGHEAVIVREAAVAALGAIGDLRGLAALLEAVRTAKPQIRRRAVVALTAFEGPEVEAALTAARLDRNPMVREVAEMVLGRDVPTAHPPPPTADR